MSCSMFDVKGYLLGELDEADRRVVEEHVAICQECREELDRLRLTEAAMLTVRDVEIPKRIAFVSDKIFEPKWWQRLWQSGPRLGFASALVLAVAIVAHGFLQPPPVKGPEPLNTAEVARMVEKEVSARVTAAVEQAVAETERRQEERTAKLLSAAELRFEEQRQADMITVRENFEYLSKRMNVMQLASLYEGGKQ